MNIGTLVVTQNGTTFNGKVKADGRMLKIAGGLELQGSEHHGKAVVYELENKKIVALYLKDEPDTILVPTAETKTAAPVVPQTSPTSTVLSAQPVKWQTVEKSPPQSVAAQSEFLLGMLLPGEGKIEPIPRKKKFVCDEIKGKNEYHRKEVEFKVADNREVVYVRLKESGEVLFEKELPKVIEPPKQTVGFTSPPMTRPVQHQVVPAKASAAQKESLSIHKNTLQKTNVQSKVSGQAATAPYNFVPLNDCIVPAEYQKPPAFDQYHEGTHTGYIQVQITTKTPVFIRGTLGQEDLQNRRESKDDERFYAPTGKPAIPGSSLRGLVKNAMQIASWAKFTVDEDYQDTELYYRAMADVCHNVKEAYMALLTDTKAPKGTPTQNKYKIKAGLLRKEGYNYFLEPGLSFEQKLKRANHSYTQTEKCLYREKTGRHTFSAYTNGHSYLVISGDMKGKSKDWLIYKPEHHLSSAEIEVSDLDVQAYKNDTRREAINLIQAADKAKGAKIPCFYTEWTDSDGNERIAFGHTGMFRLPYFKSVADHVPAVLKENVLDIPGAIFGNKDDFVGRVQFSDAVSELSYAESTMQAQFARILSGPKPTTFQHYLVQDDGSLKNAPRTLAHYNSNTSIRGYKQYWHQLGDNWADALQQQSTQNTKIQPVKSGVTFTGKIHFENLSSVELGALLFVLDLPQGCAHKIGMGKPLGLGSIEIKPTLYLSDTRARYTQLFAEWGGLKQHAIDDYKTAFTRYVLKHIGANANDLWQVDRMRQYQVLLNFEHGKELENTNVYMELGAFKQRHVLPLPGDVKPQTQGFKPSRYGGNRGY